MARLIGSISHVTAEEAAQQLETTITRVLMLLRGDSLKGAQIDGEWYVESDSVACAKAHGREMKSVGKCVSYCGGCGCK